MKKLLWALLPLAVLTSCGSSSERKVMVIASGNITVNGANLKIEDPSDGAVEQEVDLKNPGVTAFNLDNAGDKSKVDIAADNGYYILNITKDTIFGSQLVDGRDYNNSEELGLDKQKLMIDSLKLVLAGQNISAANKNYMILPGKMVKISDDLAHARVFGPFQPLNNDVVAPEDGKAPILFKFYAKDELQTRLQSVEESYNSTN